MEHPTSGGAREKLLGASVAKVPTANGVKEFDEQSLLHW